VYYELKYLREKILKEKILMFLEIVELTVENNTVPRFIIETCSLFALAIYLSTLLTINLALFNFNDKETWVFSSDFI
jgi:hypothetical protein